MNGKTLTLGAVGLLALAGAVRRRGSRTYDEDFCDGNYLHVTPMQNLEGILRHGLEPFNARTAREEPDLQGPARTAAQAGRSTLGVPGWSRDKVFFGQGHDIALAWAEMIWQNTGDADFAVLALRPGSVIESQLQEDPRGSKDVGCSFYVSGRVPPSELVRDASVERAIRRHLRSIEAEER